MLKTTLMLRTLNNTPLLTAGTTLTSKVISRALTQQNIETVEKWDLLSAVCLERHPVITKPLCDLEIRYQELLRQIEFENSLISDFEIQVKKEGEQKKKEISMDNQEGASFTQTIQDVLDFNEQELMAFKFAPRIDEAENNKLVSLKRKLDKNLILLVEQKIGNSIMWLPPQSIRKQEETMIQTAYRTLQEFCGNNINIKFYGYAPIGFYQYKYPKNVQDKGRNGAKIFFFLAKYVSGDISPNVKHYWLDRQELKEIVHPKIHKSLSQFLIPD